MTGTERVEPLSERDYRALVRAAQAAPSVYNTQPWQFRLRGHRVELWADQGRLLAHADPQGRQLVISCGAALLNLRLAMAHLGFEPRTTLFPEEPGGDHLATVERGPARKPKPRTEQLYGAIADRRTNLGRHRPEPVARAVTLMLARAARREGAVLHEIRTGEQRALLRDALRHAIGAQLTDQAFRAEFLSWLRGDGDGDGMPVSSLERAPYPTPATRTDGELTREDSDALAEIVARESFFLLATARDDRPSWLRAGQALQRVLLTAQQAGLAVSYLNQPIEAAALRGLLPATLDLPGAAQILLRIGYPWTLSPATPRRPVEQVAQQVNRA